MRDETVAIHGRDFVPGAAVESTKRAGFVVPLAVAWACGAEQGPLLEPVPSNRAPLAIGTIPPQIVPVGDNVKLELSAYFSDPDGDDLVYGMLSSDSGVVAAGVTGTMATVRAVARGVAKVTVTARDGEGGEVQQAFEVTVPNRGPVAVGEIEPRTIEVGVTNTLGVAAYFSDPDGDELVCGATSSDPTVVTAVADGSGVRVTGVARGAAAVTVTARDPSGLAAAQRVDVSVRNPPPPPPLPPPPPSN